MNDVVVGAVRALTRKPTNKVALKEDLVVLKCSSDVPNAIIWSYDSFVISSLRKPTTSVPEFSTTNNGSATDCYLRAQGSSTKRLSGPYACSDGSVPAAQAVVIVIGQ